MNISQHAIIPLGYPIRKGYFNESGSFVGGSFYRTTDMFGTYGCNRVFRSLPFSSNAVLRFWNYSSGEFISSSYISLNKSSNVFSISPSNNIAALRITSSDNYIPYIKYPFLIFYKDNTPAVSSLSFGNLLTPDTID